MCPPGYLEPGYQITQWHYFIFKITFGGLERMTPILLEFVEFVFWVLDYEREEIFTLQGSCFQQFL